MANLLDVIASKLKIRVTDQEENTREQEATYKEVTDKTRKLFKRHFNQHMYRKLRKMKIGENIDYMFDCVQSGPLEKLRCDAKDNLEEVLAKLPELPKGERYIFPQNTYISFTLIAKFPRQIKIKLNIISDVLEADLGQ